MPKPARKRENVSRGLLRIIIIIITIITILMEDNDSNDKAGPEQAAWCGTTKAPRKGV